MNVMPNRREVAKGRFERLCERVLPVAASEFRFYAVSRAFAYSQATVIFSPAPHVAASPQQHAIDRRLMWSWPHSEFNRIVSQRVAHQSLRSTEKP